MKSENANPYIHFGNSDGMEEEGILQIAFRHRVLILVVVILSLLSGGVYLLVARSVFTSESRLYVQESGPKIISDNEGMITRSNSYLYTQAEMIKSLPVIGKVADDPHIRLFKTFDDVDNPAAYLQKNIDVRIGKKDDIITVGLDSYYPQEAAQIVNSIVNSYVDSQSVRNKNVVSRILTILQEEKIKSDRDLSEKWDEILDFTRENSLVSFEKNVGNVVYQKLLRLSEAMTDGQIATINAQADWQSAKAISNEPSKVKQLAAALSQTGVSAYINSTQSELESELHKSEVELESLRNHVTREHPAAKAMQAKIELIEGNIDDEMRRFAEAYIEIMEQRWQTAKEKEETLVASYNDQLQESQSLGVETARYAMLQSELHRAERFDEILDDRIKTLNVLDTEQAGKLNIRILEIARIEEEPSSPQKARVMALMLILGLIFGMGLAFGLEWIDVRLHSVDEISSLLGLAVLGVVPSMDQTQRFFEQSRKAWVNFKPLLISIYHQICRSLPVSISNKLQGTADAFSRTASEAESALDKEGIIARGQKVHLEPKSVIAEAYRTIRTAVFFGIPKGQAKTIIVTSPEAGDGKTTLVSNLALSMAQAGQKTLIIDADFRRPKQHTVFDFDNDKGLTGVLAGVTEINDAIRPGPILGLDVISSGPEVPNPSEMLNSDAFEELLKNELCTQYARIIIDSPPVGPVADSQILAAICDVTLLVLRAEKSTRKSSLHACEILRSVGGRLPGVVVNDVVRKSGYRGYYSPYGYQYGKPYEYSGREAGTQKTQKRAPVNV